MLGPGLITGAADDDPSGIATYSQAGAQFGFSMLWVPLVTLPLMAAIQIANARVGRVTGAGLAATQKKAGGSGKSTGDQMGQKAQPKGGDDLSDDMDKNKSNDMKKGNKPDGDQTKQH